MDAVSRAWLCGFKSGGKSFNFASKRGMIFGAIGPRSGHDRATIAPRSGPNLRRGRSSGHLDAIPPLKECNRRSIAMRSWCDRGSIAPRCDRGAIAVRSHRDRGVLPEAFCAVRLESDAPDIFQKEAKIQLLVAVGSRSRSLNADEDKPSSCRHVAICEPSDRRHLSEYLRTCWIDDRVDSGPRDRSRP